MEGVIFFFLCMRHLIGMDSGTCMFNIIWCFCLRGLSVFMWQLVSIVQSTEALKSYSHVWDDGLVCKERGFKSWFSPVTLKALVKLHLHVKQGRYGTFGCCSAVCFCTL